MIDDEWDSIVDRKNWCLNCEILGKLFYSILDNYC